ncbi:unnamed protein product [Rotaria sordida]|uniref:Endonuclease/exonuclease/phosphatase domain-containing protein n=1 Tax=Rotaria sordida TaxID=392033 RepID=A0A815U358_9BILA|nr:unnamed protein product [Rotaria sordida]CAF4071070.1 unnamed protein product [Rotaria sordida]CAF4123530.1 unnamed protein product [Rotaria sordida]
MASNSRIRLVFDKDNSTKILIQIVYEISSTNICRQFNLLRSMDESVSQTIYRLTANIERVRIKEIKLNKCHRKEQTEITSNIEKQIIVVELFDNNGQTIDKNQTNKQARLNCRRLSVNGQSYNVEHNAPAIINFHSPEKILTNTITTAFVEIDYGPYKYSLFDWYVTDDVQLENDHIQWIHVHHGTFCIFHDEHVNKFVRLVCLPRNNSLREISYNILANGYASTADAVQTIYSYCPQDYLEYDYRKALLSKEILGYHADIISLQECDTLFYQRELSLVLKQYGYLDDMKIKNYGKIIKDFDYKTPIGLSTYSNYAYTIYTSHFRHVIDHIFYDSKTFQFQRSTPMPTRQRATEFTALPSCKVQNDHLAIVIELEIVKS